MIRAQLEGVFEDFTIAATKTGMLGNAEAVAVVAEMARAGRLERLVVDPVMVSSSGHPLLEEEAIGVLTERLLPQAFLCTPNRAEAEVLSERAIRSITDAEQAARDIRARGARAVLIKGGHLGSGSGETPGDGLAVDLLFDGESVHRFEAPRMPDEAPHGTGCALASAIATHLGRGATLIDAIAQAKRFVGSAMRRRVALGHGQTVLGIDPDPEADGGS
jgi:hydroxymethylpyrimidine/phosphomethylpyrimidine kinase